MVQYVITPWRNEGELLQVRSQLYPYQGRENHTSDQSTYQEEEKAVARVRLWMQRGNCPHMVESTAILTSAILNDRRGGNESYCVRAVYAAAFSRFVTGLLDCHQDKRYKLSMYGIAKRIGLPATFVELRHQATHEELPSLIRLRTATSKALDWIWSYYWIHLSSPPVSSDSNLSNNLDRSGGQKEDCEDWFRNILLLGTKEDHDDTFSVDDVLGRIRESHHHNCTDHQLLSALFRIQNSVGEDVSVLLRIAKLQAKIMEGNSFHNTTQSQSKTKTSLDEIRAELEIMNDNLMATVDAGEEVEEEQQEVKGIENNTPVQDSTSKGWTLWQGPWTSKPIGIV